MPGKDVLVASLLHRLLVLFLAFSLLMGRSALFRSTDEQKDRAHARRIKYNQSERYAEAECLFDRT